MNPMVGPMRHTRSARDGALVILALSGFVTAFGAHVVATNLPAYATTVGVGAFMIGLLIGVYDFAELFAKPVAGVIADRRGMKLTLMVGLAVFVLGSLLYLVVPPRLLLLVRFIQGLGAAALSTVSIALVAKYFPDGRGQAFGIYNGVKGAGYVIAPAIGGFLAQQYGFAWIFLVSAAVGVVTFALSGLLPADRTTGARLEDDEDVTLAAALRLFTESRLLPIYGVIVVNMVLVGILFGFLPVYLYGLSYTPLQSGATVSVATLSYVVVQPLAGVLADRVDVRVTVLGGLGLAALAIIVVPFTSGRALLVVAVLAGLGIGTVWTNSDTLVSTLVEPNQLATGMGAAQSFKEFGDMTGPVVVGFLTQVYGVRVGFVTSGALALMLLIALMRSLTRSGVRQRSVRTL